MKQVRPFVVCAILVVVMILIAWFSQSSINTYWQQTYHTDSPLVKLKLEQFTVWRQGARAQEVFVDAKDKFFAYVESLTHLNINENSELENEDAIVTGATLGGTDSSDMAAASASHVATQEEQPASSIELEHSSPLVETEQMPSIPSDSVEKISSPKVADVPVEHTPAPAVADVPVEHPPAPAVADVAVEHTPTPTVEDVAVEHTPPSAVADVAVEHTPTPAVADIPVEHSPIPVSADVAIEPNAYSLTVNREDKSSDRVETHSVATTSSQPQLVHLTKHDKVFFAGDSLMQGVAPFCQKWLKQEHDIESINLSKQSTGLSYPQAFDWPATIEKTLKANPSIAALVVFLGPNDPWDFPDPEHKGGHYLKFKSAQWEQVYLSRVQRILDIAQQHQVKVIWLGIPYMRKNSLNEQMLYLDALLENYLKDKVIWLPTKQLLSGANAGYVDSIEINGKTTRMRSKDGIHFTPAAQRMLSEYIQSKLAF